MKALLLAAGKGTRLAPLTEVLPKCLVPVLGRPLLEYWLHITHGAGLPALVNVHSHASVVTTFLEGHPYAGLVQAVYEPDLLGTGGTLLKNRSFFRGGPVLLVHADNLSLFSISSFLAAHKERPANCPLTMMTFDSDTPSSCGIVEIDERGIVVEFHEKVANPPGNRANAAVYILEPEILEHLQGLGKEFIDFSEDVIPAFLGRIYHFHNSEYHRDIGNMSAYLQAQREFPTRPVFAPREGQPDTWAQVLQREGRMQALEELLVMQNVRVVREANIESIDTRNTVCLRSYS